MLPLLRVCLALWLISARKCVWVLEQPISSLAHRHPRFQELLKTIRIFRASLWLSHYGAPSPKRVKLFSNSSGIKAFRTPKLTRRLREALPVRLAASKVKADGSKSYTGDKQALGESSSEAQLPIIGLCTIIIIIPAPIIAPVLPKVLSARIWEKVWACLAKTTGWAEGSTQANAGGRVFLLYKLITTDSPL